LGLEPTRRSSPKTDWRLARCARCAAQRVWVVLETAHGLTFSTRRGAEIQRGSRGFRTLSSLAAQSFKRALCGTPATVAPTHRGPQVPSRAASGVSSRVELALAPQDMLTLEIHRRTLSRRGATTSRLATSTGRIRGCNTWPTCSGSPSPTYARSGSSPLSTSTMGTTASSRASASCVYYCLVLVGSLSPPRPVSLALRQGLLAHQPLHVPATAFTPTLAASSSTAPRSRSARASSSARACTSTAQRTPSTSTSESLGTSGRIRSRSVCERTRMKQRGQCHPCCRADPPLPAPPRSSRLPLPPYLSRMLSDR